MDDRCELFGDHWLEDYVQAEDQDTAGHMRTWQRQYGPFDLALTRTGSGYDDYFRAAPEWVPVQRTGTATLYQRQELESRLQPVLPNPRRNPDSAE